MKSLSALLPILFLLAFDTEARRLDLQVGEGVDVGSVFVACGGNTGGRGTCNQHGCSTCGTCNSYGCPKCDSGYSGGTCNAWGCWDSAQGTCNSYGCTNAGECNEHGCSENGACNSYGCPDHNGPRIRKSR